MQDPRSSVRHNRPRIADAIIDDEVMIIDLVTGRYHELTAIGAYIWALIGRGVSGEQIVQDLRTRYGAGLAETTAAVSRFVRTLEDEELVVPLSPGSPEPLVEVTDQRAGNGPQLKRRLEIPTLRTHTDMEAKLFLYPIEETDDAGWLKG